MADDTQGRLDGELHGLKDDLCKIGEDVTALLHLFKELGSEQVGEARETMEEELTARQDELRQRLAGLKSRGERTAGSLESEVRERPLQSLLLAFGAGYVMAKILRR